MHSQKAIVLVSGGLDSCVTAAIAAQHYTMAFLHVNYGQRTEQREMRAFNEIADHYKIDERLTVDLSHLRTIGGSSLTDPKIAVSPANLHSDQIPGSYVPFRNGNILSTAASWAEVIHAQKIFIGAVEEDASGYPDTRKAFFKAFNKVIENGTKPETRIEIITPVIHWNKKQIVEEGFALNAPLQLTWSCYQNEEVACGVCDSCAFRLRGFQQAGLNDPLPYEKIPDYRQ
ncbi:MAG: 7-cyano-7-deazaguanine synthase QueC [Caldithrix sp.]|nr:7-cyano-7-deazaguanine synthase QueC [Caldithrix sp.]